MRHKFAAGRCEDSEMPLVFRSALIPLAQAAYLKMDKDGLDALVLNRMLELAPELDIVLPATDDDDLTSLRVVRWKKTRSGWRDDRDQRTGASSRPASSPIVCFKCGQDTVILGATLFWVAEPPSESCCTSHLALALTSFIRFRCRS
ncbi:unnamed protein product [Lampetra planeri]